MRGVGQSFSQVAADQQAYLDAYNATQNPNDPSVLAAMAKMQTDLAGAAVTAGGAMPYGAPAAPATSSVSPYLIAGAVAVLGIGALVYFATR